MTDDEVTELILDRLEELEELDDVGVLDAGVAVTTGGVEEAGDETGVFRRINVNK